MDTQTYASTFDQIRVAPFLTFISSVFSLFSAYHSTNASVAASFYLFVMFFSQRSISRFAITLLTISSFVFAAPLPAEQALGTRTLPDLINPMDNITLKSRKLTARRIAATATQARINKALTQEQLAAKAGVPLANVVSVENFRVTKVNLRKIERVLGLRLTLPRRAVDEDTAYMEEELE
ncbi:hypothetical protein MIND_00379300 [Mycena indigotica]|uniref:Uncharacterized protein n=1 Tax=Mycena indigotica TaxID=2126181 RepID=A0A8H6T1R6_9AGAR|nr:uncharacterized protein MIND_00379300 [Mycena indigotica]KAF7310063.1 hypothetical protein MIND_00379300 [Mycena indigotica]